MNASWLSVLALSLLLGRTAAEEPTQVQHLHAWTGSRFLLNSQCQADQGHLQVTFGSLIKLVHEGSKAKLHSHEIAYGSGSGQQSVTGMHLQELQCIFLSSNSLHSSVSSRIHRGQRCKRLLGHQGSSGACLHQFGCSSCTSVSLGACADSAAGPCRASTSRRAPASSLVQCCGCSTWQPTNGCTPTTSPRLSQTSAR